MVIHQDALLVVRFASDLQGDVKCFRVGFAVRQYIQDIHHAVETIRNAQHSQRAAGVCLIGIGEYELPGRGVQQNFTQPGVWLDVLGQGDVMHISQVLVNVNPIIYVQPAQGGAIFVEKLHARLNDIFERDANLMVHEIQDPVSHSFPDSAVGGIQGVVKVKKDGCKRHTLKYTRSWFADGQSFWYDSVIRMQIMDIQLSQEEYFRYSRHLMLPEVGVEGQKKLKGASVLITGTGGLGSPIALYLAAAGIGRIGLVDYDTVEVSNLQRQIIHGTGTVGVPKVESARARISDLNPHVQVEIHNEVLTSQNIMEIASGYDVLVDGSDNLATRYLLNDYAVITGKPYIYGSIFRFEGQVSVFDSRSGPCYRCLFPVPPPPELMPNCSSAGVLGVLPGIIGTIQANETIKVLLGVGQPLVGRLLLFDALEMRFSEILLRKNPACPVCGETPTIHALIDYEQFCGATYRRAGAQDSPEFDLLPLELHARLKNGEKITLVDVRDPVESQVSFLPDAVIIPLERLAGRLGEIPRDYPVVLFCRTGSRSLQAAAMLKQAGFPEVKYLKGGINAWAVQVDPGMKQY